MRTVANGLLLALLAGATSPGLAQGNAEPSPEAKVATPAEPANPPRTGMARFFDPEDGQLDLSHFLENARGFLPIPIVITEPAVGYGGGLAAMFLRPRRETGSEGFARPDIAAVGAFGTENGTRGGFAADVSRWMDGRLRTLIGAGTGRVHLDFYGLGPDTASLDQKVRYSLDFTGAVGQVNWQLAPKSPWAVGMRYVYADVKPKLRDEPAFPGLADGTKVKVSAPTAVLEYDTRDNLFTPTRGVYSETSYLVSRESLGSSDDFERFQQVLMGWVPLPNRVTLGARGNYAWSSSGTPFFLRPFIVMRGVPAMRFQGESTASIEGEGRWQFNERWSAVGFLGTGAAKTRNDDFSSTEKVTSGGAGLRYKLARKFGMDVGMDVAHSPGTTAIYLIVGNSWFRP